MRSNTFNKRLAVLEERAKPRIIATLVDFVIWCAEDEPDEDAELSPQMQEFVDEASKHIGEKGNT
jgi:hypothetical protein